MLSGALYGGALNIGVSLARTDSQSAGHARNCAHLLEPRPARSLLMTRDWAQSGEFKFRVTHEFLAFMIGARRLDVSKAARSDPIEPITLRSRRGADERNPS